MALHFQSEESSHSYRHDRHNIVVERETTRDLSGAARLVTAAEKCINANACQGLPPSPKGLLPSALAAALKVSRRYLEIRFKEVKGEGIAEAIRRRTFGCTLRTYRQSNKTT